MFDFGINVLLNPSSFIGPANQVIGVLNQLQAAIAKFGTSTGGGSRTLETEFTRLNQVVAQSKATFESFGSSTSNFRNSMGQIGQSTQQAVQGISIFGQKLNEARANLASAESTFKSLGPAFGSVSSAATQLSSGLTPLGGLFTQLATNARATATAITPLGTLFSGMEARMAAVAATAINTGNAFKAGLTTSLAGLSSSVASVGGPLNNLNSQLTGTAGGLTNAGNAANQSATGFGRLREMFQGNRGLVFGFSAFFGTLTGIAFELQLVNDANAQVAASQAVLNSLVEQGKQGTHQYAQAQQALAKDQRFLEFSSRNLGLAFTNLVPDVLLMINGVIQLTDKMKAAGTGASAMATGMQTVSTGMTATNTAATAANAGVTALSTGMTTATTATTTFSAAGTAVTSSLTPMRGALQTTTVALAETVAAESTAILTSEGLVASNAEMGLSAQGASKAIQSIVPAAGEAGAAEATLIEENIALGASFDAMGVQAKAAGNSIGSLGKTGGIKGALSGLLSGGGALGMAGPIGLGALAVGGFAIGLNELSKFVTDTVGARILAENENGKIKESFGTLINDLGTDFTTATDDMATVGTAHGQLTETIVSNNAKIAASTQTTPVVPGKPAGKAGTVEGLGLVDQGKLLTPGIGPKNLAAQPQQPGSWEQKLPDIPATRAIQEREEQQKLLDLTRPENNPWLKLAAPTPPSTADYLQNFMKQATATGQIPKGPTSAQLLPNFQGSSVAGGLTPDKLEKLLQIQQDLTKAKTDYDTEVAKGANTDQQAAAALTLRIQNLQQEGVDLLNSTEANKTVKEATDKATDSLVKHNEEIGKMPQALQQALGVQQQYTEQVMIEGKMTTISDQALIEHDKMIRQSAVGYTSLAAVQNVSLGVQTQLVDIGNKVVGGVEEEANHVQALNIFWNEMNSTIKEGILSNQALTISSIDVTAALTNQTQNQFLTNEGMIAGKEAAQQFAEELVVGAAQTKAYDAGIQQIADTMGLELPAGIIATTEQIKAAALEFKLFGTTASTSAEIVNTAFGDSFANVGKLVEAAAQGGKEFSKAWKDFDLGDVPNKLKGFFKDMTKDLGEGAKQFKQLTDLVDLSVTALETKTLSKGRATQIGQAFIGGLHDVIASGAPQMKSALEPIEIFVSNLLANKDISKSDLVAGLTKAAFLIKTVVTPAFADHIPVGKELDEIMAKISQTLGAQVSVVTKVDSEWKKFFSTQKEVAKGADQFKKGISGLLDFEKDFGKEEESKKDLKDLRSGKKTLKDLPGTVHGTPEKRPILPQFQGGGTVVGGGDITGKGDLAKLWESAGGDKTPIPNAKAVQTATAAINTALASTQTAFANLSNQGTNSMALLVGHLKAHMTTLNTYFAKTIPTELAASQVAFANFAIQGSNSIALLVGRLKAHMTTLTTYFAKTIPTDLALSQVAFANLSIQGSNSMALLIAHLKAHITTITTYFTKTIPTDLQASTDAFALFQENATGSMNVLIAVLKAHVTTITTYFTKTIPEDLTTAAEAFETFNQDTSKSMAQLISTLKAHVTTIGTYFTKTIPDALQTAADAASQFASDFESSMSDVETAANNAMSAVSNLADEVGQLDGMSAVVTVTTNFKTTGTPPKQTGDVTINRQMGAVIDAASPKSFQYGGSIETSHGPQMAIFGDNPGGQETVAFIPHDNPFPTLRKLEKLFKGRSSSETIDRAIDRAGEIIINATFVIENIMDGQKVGTTIAKRVFKKMRTR